MPFGSGETSNFFFDVVFAEAGFSVVGDLSEDGILNYTVSSTGGDFKLLGAGIKATFQDRSVPDNGLTIPLLGFSLFSMFIAQRKRK